MILYNDDNTRYLEKSGNWVDCVQYLIEKWQVNKENVPIMLKLSVNAWYTLTIDGSEISLNRKERDFLSQTLLEVYRYFIACFEYNVTCQWIFGYLMIVRTDLFLSLDLDYLVIEHQGESLIEKASKSGDLFAQLLYARNYMTKKEFSRINSKIKENLQEYFDKNEVVDSYFIEVLMSDF
jgi:hypothetical protein